IFAIDDTKDSDDDRGQKHFCEKCGKQITRDIALSLGKYANINYARIVSQLLKGVLINGR
ncbi:hypothetical protein, partial [Sarcina ventriculi]|uniref:hypothetical protein n=1 Tax=Sarcina ventriculi TaxID=1267 RepID=UPI00135AE5E0